ncbi:MAG: hypothetical protein AAB582_02275 [Patescibacteria group bacterium]
MSLYVILQPFAREYGFLFWNTLYQNKLNPHPLFEARKVYLSEGEIQELMVNCTEFDIVSSRTTVDIPFRAIELNLALFPGERGIQRFQAAMDLLEACKERPVEGLSTQDLFKEVPSILRLRPEKRNRIAKLSDALFWAKDTNEEEHIERFFKPRLVEVT